jgi:hypothetical protein
VDEDMPGQLFLEDATFNPLLHYMDGNVAQNMKGKGPKVLRYIKSEAMLLKRLLYGNTYVLYYLETNFPLRSVSRLSKVKLERMLPLLKKKHSGF